MTSVLIVKDGLISIVNRLRHKHKFYEQLADHPREAEILTGWFTEEYPAVPFIITHVEHVIEAYVDNWSIDMPVFTIEFANDEDKMEFMLRYL